MADRPILDARTARILPWVVAVAFFMQRLDGTILNTALPTMAKDLDANPLQMQSVVIAYMLTVAVIIPASGWLADKFGIRQIFLSPSYCSRSDRSPAACRPRSKSSSPAASCKASAAR